jgi:hypothetical protein
MACFVAESERINPEPLNYVDVAGKVSEPVLNWNEERDRAGSVALSVLSRGRNSSGAEPEIRAGSRNFLETPFIQRNEARLRGAGWRTLPG